MKLFSRPLFISSLIIILSLFLRLTVLEARSPFDWDQNRDYQEVARIAKGRATLIGPVAKGEGGFFLGPLYYYLLAPGFIISGGHPLSLPTTSLILDTIAIAFMLYLGFYLKRPALGYLLSLLWAVSPVAIDSALISWNVALLPLWFIFMLLYLTKSSYNNRDLILGGVLAGLSWHIHAVLIPLAPLIMLARAKSLLTPRFSNFVVLLGGYIISLSPLILFDLRHMGLESNLLFSMIEGSQATRAPWLHVVESTLLRFGKNISGFFGGSHDLNRGLGLVGLAIGAIAILRGSLISRLAGLSIIINLGLVIGLGVVGFPEYYLLVSTIALCLILADYAASAKLGIMTLVLLAMFMAAQYNPSPTPYSLKNKMELASEIKRGSQGQTVALNYDLAFGRESGIPILLARAGVNTNEQGKVRYLITEKPSESLFINGELATHIGYYGAFRLARHDVQ